MLQPMEWRNGVSNGGRGADVGRLGAYFIEWRTTDCEQRQGV
jgi:hypothetical protein